MPLSVMQVIGNSVICGAERHVFDLVQGLSQSGIEVEVICPRPGPLTEQLARSAIPIHCLEMVRPWPHDEYVLDRQALQALIALFGEKHPDVVHSHLYPAHLHASLAAHAVGIPTIVYTAHTLITRPGEGIVSSVTDCHLIAVSRHVARLLERVGVPSARVQVIYNGVGAEHIEDLQETQRRLRTELKLGTGPLIGTVSRLSPEKGVDVLIHATQCLVRVQPALTVLIIGDGPLATELRQLTDRLGLGNSIRFLGARTDVPTLNRLLDVFVLPSREEACPMALLEAMAAGRAVVATHVGGIPEIVEQNVEGSLVPPDDPPALAQAILSLLTNPARRTAMGTAARQKVAASFTRDRMVRETLALYQRKGGQKTDE